jgi:hypothetical protein
LPHREANRIYELGKASLDGWMKQYGSPEYEENMRRKNHTNLQKRTVVTAIEQGRMSIKEAQNAIDVNEESYDDSKNENTLVLTNKAKKILVIENNADMRIFIIHELRKEYKVIEGIGFLIHSSFLIWLCLYLPHNYRRL